MKKEEIARYWDENAENWTKLSRLGYDRCRDLINSPAFFKMLLPISGLKGLDLGCGEGHNTRIAAKQGASMTAIDISKVFISHAIESEKEEPLGITYHVADASNLPFPKESFDFVMATMSLMDIPDTENVLLEVNRVLKPSGFFQFSISHPCFSSLEHEWIKDENGKKTGYVIRDYFKRLDGEIDEWIYGAAPKDLTDGMNKFKIPLFRQTLSEWLNLLMDSGFLLERFCEPQISQELLKKHPEEYDSLIIPFFLIIRCRNKCD
ncbi:MAG: class I SAM-dependent methyltransferase [Promethearchaeota archaeon]|nr:MAG: class I SAM-dependent methyltransferase [Candidatus Lokiarchaeota archaeon]